MGGAGHSPGNQSASLGRATAGGVDGVDGSGGAGVGASASGASGDSTNASVPRRNSLGDLKIPGRIRLDYDGIWGWLGSLR